MEIKLPSVRELNASRCLNVFSSRISQLVKVFLTNFCGLLVHLIAMQDVCMISVYLLWFKCGKKVANIIFAVDVLQRQGTMLMPCLIIFVLSMPSLESLFIVGNLTVNTF
jgi:hypothetical protein